MDAIIPHNLTQGVLDFGEQAVDHVLTKLCPRCGNNLPETAEYWHRKGSGQGFRVPCKSCRHAEYLVHSQEIIARNREAFLAKSPEEQERIRNRQNKHRRERSVRETQRGICSKCLARPASSGHNICDRCLDYQKRSGDRLRNQVFAAYGGKCIQCGETHPAFLSVDHIGNDGADHRRVVGGGQRLYWWLRQNNFPQEGFQLLCANCNWLKYVSRKQVKKTYIMIWHASLRQETLAAYGGKCACCGEKKLEVLTIDHVNNDGAKHRRQVGAGSVLYAWLRKNGFPKDGFQVLCFNCNRARYYHGICPHQLEVRESSTLDASV